MKKWSILFLCPLMGCAQWLESAGLHDHDQDYMKARPVQAAQLPEQIWKLEDSDLYDIPPLPENVELTQEGTTPSIYPPDFLD